METILLVLGITSILSRLGILYWIKRRKLSRRNSSGIEGFQNPYSQVNRKMDFHYFFSYGYIIFWIHSTHKQQKENTSSNVKIF